jgi:Rhodopirellula transposase DDE domain
MIALQDPHDRLLCSAATRLTGWERRLFIGEVTLQLCDGNVRRSERRFGWGRETARKGLEQWQGVWHEDNYSARGRPRAEEKNPQLAVDIRKLVEPRTQADPEMKSTRRYTNMAGAEVRQALIDEKGYREECLPSERTFRTILNRLGYRLKRIQKSKPLKKTPQTDAIFANIAAVRAEARADPHTLEISVDTKAKVDVGDYSRGGKCRSDAQGHTPAAWDHDPPPQDKFVPLGVLMMATAALTVIFGNHETSDFWVDGFKLWWLGVKADLGHIKRLVIYLDNGPHNSGCRTQFLKRMIEFADWTGLEIRLVYYPPYHSKYNRIERCWGAMEKKWNGALLNCWKAVSYWARRMTWCGKHPTIERLGGDYPDGVTIPPKERKQYEARLLRSATLPKYDITILPNCSKNG